MARVEGEAVGLRFSRITHTRSVLMARFELWTPVSIWIQKAVDCLKPAGWKNTQSEK